MITDIQKKSLRAASVANVKKYVGTLEAPPWSNRGILIDSANTFVGNSPLDEPAYCCALCCLNAAVAAHSVGLNFEDTALARTGYCPTMYQYAKALGNAIDAQLVVSGQQIVEPGDLMLEYMPKLLGYHHAETVVVPPSKGKPSFSTVGGNTVPDGYHGPPGHEGQGFGVFARHRCATDKAAGGHNLYCFVKLTA